MSTNKSNKPITVPAILRMKEQGQKITMLTAYDALMAQILDESGIDIILVGDSGGMVVGGHENTLAVTMEEMLFYAKAVRRGVKRAFVAVDMPFMSYQVSTTEAIKNAGRFLQEAGAEAVKLEGGKAIAETVHSLVQLGIPVIGHLGLTPQSIHQLGGYQVQGTKKEIAQQIKDDARLLEEAGVFSIVLEKIPSAIAAEISRSLRIPTIGIGAGKDCDGQVLVSHDLLGLYEKFKPKFVRRYAEMGKEMKDAFSQYIKDVQSGQFPNDDESY
jgi:3-methyl-2-oxobutanoate hydroxymethyltransferase